MTDVRERLAGYDSAQTTPGQALELVEPEAVRFEFTGGEFCAVPRLHARFTPVQA